MDERSKRAQMERKRRIRRKKQRRRVLISALVEVLILAVLALAFCWDRGLSARACLKNKSCTKHIFVYPFSC